VRLYIEDDERALRFARARDATFVLVYRWRYCERVMLVAPESCAA